MKRGELIICIVLFVLAFSLNIFPIRISHWWDETVYLQNAETLFSGRTNYNEFAFRPPLLSILFFLIFFVWHSATAATIITVFISSLAPTFIFLMGKKIYNFETGIIAALLFIVSPFVILNSHFLLTDIPAVSLVSISFYYLIRNVKEIDYFISGIFFSFAILMKFTYVLFAVVFLAYWILFKCNKKKILLSIAGGAAAIVPYFIWSSVAYGNPLATFIKGITMVSEKTEYFLFYIFNLHEAFNVVALAGLVIWIIYFVFAFRRKKFNDFRFDILLAIWFIVFMGFLSRMSHKELRYIFPIAVPFMLLASRGICVLTNKLKNKKIVYFVFAVLIVFAGVYSAVTQIDPERFGELYIPIKQIVYDTTKSDEMKIAEFIKTNLSETELVYVRHQWPVIAYYSGKNIEIMPADYGDYYTTFYSKIKENQVVVASEYDEGYYYPTIFWLENEKELFLIREEGTMRVYGYNETNSR